MPEDQTKKAVRDTLEKLGRELYRRKAQAKRAKEAVEAIDYLQANQVFKD
jgi:hypothetical protein